MGKGRTPKVGALGDAGAVVERARFRYLGGARVTVEEYRCNLLLVMVIIPFIEQLITSGGLSGQEWTSYERPPILVLYQNQKIDQEGKLFYGNTIDRRGNNIETLRKCAFLSGLDENVLGNLATSAETLRIPAGETIITRGEAGSAMYFIISGSARVHDGEVTWANIEAGDFYDVFKLNNSPYIAIVIGDVCDKGVGAALFMTLFRSLIRASSLYGFLDSMAPDGTGSTSEVLQNSLSTTNRYIATTHAGSSMFASVFFGLLDPQTGGLTYINAGHEAPMIFRQNGNVDLLDITGGVVGLFPAAAYTVESATLNEGGLIFSYTDGINEAKSLDGDQFGDERILQAAPAGGPGTEVFLKTMLDAVREFRGEAEQSDDITMLALKYLAPVQ